MAFEVGARLVMIGLAASFGSTAQALEHGASSSATSPIGSDSVLEQDVLEQDVLELQDAAPESPPPAEAAPPAAATPGKAVKPAPAPADPDAEEKETSEEKAGEAGTEKAPADSEAPASPPEAGAEPGAAEPGAAEPGAGVAAGAEAAPPPAPAVQTDPNAAAAAPASAPEPSYIPVDVVPGASVLGAAAPASPVPAVGQVAPDAPAPLEAGGLQVGLTPNKATDATTDQGSNAPSAPAGALPATQIGPVFGGLSISFGTQMSFGQSTFQTGSSYARDPMVDWSVSLAPAYMFRDGTRVSASASLSQELTQANGDDDPYTVIFSDIGVGVSRPIYRFEDGPSFHGSVSAGLPTSTASQVDTLRATLGGRITASQGFSGIGVSLGSGFRKNFHEYTVPTRDPRTGEGFRTRDGLVVDEVVTGISRLNGSELAGATYFDGESNNTSMIWSSALSASYQASAKLGFGISYNLSFAWTYESFPLDEFSGVGAQEGRGRRDSHGGSVFANYQPLDQLGFGLGMGTGGPTRTADDKHIRFPFFNLQGPESNMTTFFISATYTESISL